MPHKVLWLLFAGLLSWPAAAERRFALFIGSNLAPPGRGALRFAHHDARKIRDVFVQLGHVRWDDQALLIDPSVDAIYAALTQLQTRAQSHHGNKSILFYYSGHADQQDALLGRQRFSLTEIRQLLDNTDFTMRLAIIDACQSGAMTQVKGATRVKGYQINWQHDAAARGAALITSSSAEEASVESDDIGGSLFTHFLTSALYGAADYDRDGAITLSEAFAYTYAQTVNRSIHTRSGVQHPTYEYELAGQKEYRLTTLKQPNAAILYFDGNTAGSYLLYSRDRNEVVAELEKTRNQPQKLLVAPGNYYLKKRQRSNILLQKVVLRSGETVRVTDWQMRTIPYDEDVTKGRLSPQFRPTWMHGAPPTYRTAYTLRRGEFQIGLLQPTAYGLSDDVMIATNLLFDVFGVPNLSAKYRILQSSRLAWSIQTEYLYAPWEFPLLYVGRDWAETVDAVFHPKKLTWQDGRSEWQFTAGTWVTAAVARFFHLSLGAGWAFISTNRDTLFMKTTTNDDLIEFDYRGSEAHQVTVEMSLLFLLGEHDQIRLDGNIGFGISDPYYSRIKDRFYPSGGAYYAHAWGGFSLGGGIKYPMVILNLVEKRYPLPYVDVVYRW